MTQKLHSITVSHGRLSKEITERKRVEAELVRVKKYETSAILAGGIAHDFNNLLTIIIGNLDMAIDEVPRGIFLEQILTRAQTSSLQAKNLVDKFINLATSAELAKTITPLNQLLINSASKQVRDSDVHCDFALPENMWEVEVDRDRITMAFDNIIRNAIDYTPRNGFVKISGENILVGEETTHRLLPLPPGEYVKISIIDQGTGIPNEYLDKVFDPYFSTRERGKEKGMGLGLPISNAIIRKHNGIINIESNLKKGTTVCIYLPAIATAKS